MIAIRIYLDFPFEGETKLRRSVNAVFYFFPRRSFSLHKSCGSDSGVGMKNSTSHAHVLYLVDDSYKLQSDSVTASVMISVFIISSQSVTPKCSRYVGCSAAGVDTTNIWLQQVFAYLSNRQEVSFCANCSIHKAN